MGNEKKAILTDKAPQPIGPYSQAIEANGLIYCSGQIPLDPQSGKLAAEDVQGQTRKVMENLSAVLTQAGSSLDKIVKTTIFIKSMNDFPKINEVYGSFFTGTPPARSTVEVSRLPKDVLVEVDAIALK